MHSDNRDSVGLAIRAAFDLRFRIVPVAPHGKRKSHQAAPVISAGHLEKQLDIGEGAFGRKPVTRPEDRADAKLFDGFREDLIGRCPAGLTSKVLKDFQDGAENGVSNRAAVRPEVKPRPITIRRSRQRCNGVRDFVFG